MIKKIVERVLDKCLRFKSFQDYINFRYKRNGYIPVPILENSYYSYKNYLFEINNEICGQLGVIDEVMTVYEFDDITENDIVLDIGANIGAFTIPAARKAKKVYAVEPLYSDILLKNLTLSDIKNVKVFEIGLGETEQNINYGGRNKTVKCITLGDIIRSCGEKINFLKIDCEGGEWCIKPEELEYIRRIEVEIHNFDKSHNFQDFINILEEAGFNCTIGDKSTMTIIVHANRK